jgi:DNA repair exonuclease SbcCD ATPase subunit
MKASQLLRYLNEQQQAIDAVVRELDEVQVAFNAQFDDFKAQHDMKLVRLTGDVYDRLAGEDGVGSALHQAIEARLPEETRLLEARRQKVRDEYLPRRHQAADEVLQTAQAEMAHLRTLNPQLDEEEESLKRQKAELGAHLQALNDEIRTKSRGLGVVRHFLDITRADRERQRVLGKLEAVNESLQNVRRRWEQKRTEIEENQARYQHEWQMESIAVARLQSELDQLDDDAQRAELALRRAIHHVLDNLKAPAPGSDQALNADLDEMVELNIETDNYHDALATVGGLIGLLRGIRSGLEAVGKSVNGLQREYEMHSSYLSPLSFHLPDRVDAFHQRWPDLARQFVDEEVVGQHPVEFAQQVKPMLDGPLSEANVKAMFDALGEMIERATAAW